MNVSSATGLSSSGISLRSIFPDATFLNTDDLSIRSCSSALSDCRNNDLFVALVHPEHDGHEDVALAVRKGASAVLTERLLPVSTPQCIVSDSRIAYGKVCQALAGDPCQRLNTIGVAGTDGKTTTSHLITSILETAGLSTGLNSSIHQKPRYKAPEGQTELTPPRLAETLATMVMAGNGHGVIETGSVQLAQHHYAGIKLDVAAVTNLRGSHFGFHGNLENYRRSQLRLLDYLKSDGVAILNADDPGTYFQLDQIKKPTLTTGIKQDADVRATVVESNLHEMKFTITAGDETVMIRTRIPGSHHVHNCLTAAATALVLGIDLATIARGIERVESLPGRMNLINCGQDFTVAVDESSSPFRLGVALNLLKKNTTGKVYCIFNTPANADERIAAQFGRIAERECHVPVITRANSKGDKKIGDRLDYEPIHQVLDGFRRPAKAQVMPDRIAAIEWALTKAQPGDAILIAGRGEKPIASLADGRWNLTDSEVCESWLYGQSVPGQRIPISTFSSPILKMDNYRQC